MVIKKIKLFFLKAGVLLDKIEEKFDKYAEKIF